jgi:glycosyltransferase involved in cell wall biosynthesis
LAKHDVPAVNGGASGPRISVITATRNVGSTLPALYETLVRQTHKDFEWVVADGLSTDDTVTQLQSFATQSPWLRFTSEPDFGVYHALNKAIARATGDYYVVVGADDLLEEQALAKYAEILKGDAADVVLAHVMRDGTDIGGFHPAKAWVGTARVFAGSHSVGMLIRTALHARFGYYSRRFPLLADVYFLKVLLRSGSVRFVDADFIAGTFSEGGLTSVNKLQILAENWQIQLLTERFPLFQTLLFFGKILIRYPSLRRELRAVKTARS